MSEAERGGPSWTQMAAMSLTSRSLYPFVLAALARVPRAQRAGVRVLDVPAGDGVLSLPLRAAGFDVTPADLFPEYLDRFQQGLNRSSAVATFERMTRAALPVWLKEQLFGAQKDAPIPDVMACVGADMEGALPFADGEFDVVVCSEGIEHVVDRHKTLRELRRVLKPGGTLLITTPNLMSVRARLAYLFAGQRAMKSWVDEHTSVWGQARDAAGIERTYHGHAFLLTYFQLRYSLWHTGFRITRMSNSNWSLSSVLLWPLVAPLVAAGTWYAQRPAKKKFAKLEEFSRQTHDAARLAYRLPEGTQAPYAEQFGHLLSSRLMLNATMIVEAVAR